MTADNERRRAPRMPVSLSLQQHVEGQTHHCLASNLSREGLYMERPLSSFMRHSTQVVLEISLPDGLAEPLWAGGDVVYDAFDALSHGSAVCFTHMSPPDRERLERWLEASCSNPDACAA